MAAPLHRTSTRGQGRQYPHLRLVGAPRREVIIVHARQDLDIEVEVVDGCISYRAWQDVVRAVGGVEASFALRGAKVNRD